MMTFLLLIAGGTVTSKGAGLAVPDWPTSYGYNMFLFPPSMWVGNIFWEHIHRLLASLVGLLCIVMAVWLWLTQRHRTWLRWVGVALLAMVIIQGVMGGLRVIQLSTTLAIVHGMTAQLFLCLTVLIAAATSGYWALSSKVAWVSSMPHGDPELHRLPHPGTSGGRGGRRPHALSRALMVLLFIQLGLGAATRHCGAGLAIPDFPTAYGRLVPPFEQQAIDIASDRLMESHGGDEHGSYTGPQVGLHFAHRVGAVLVCMIAGGLIMQVYRWGRAYCVTLLTRPAMALAMLLLIQVGLGASVIWTRRLAEVATSHQAVGAAVLATAALLTLRIHRFIPRGRNRKPMAKAQGSGNAMPAPAG